jgi:hypothetical protein
MMCVVVLGPAVHGLAGDQPPRAGQPIYMRTQDGPPWNRSANEDRLNDVFGAGGWTVIFYESAAPASIFSPETPFVFMEGGQDSNGALATFVDANRSLMESWVTSGGTLLINTAPVATTILNVGFGVTVSSYDASDTGTAADPGHAVFAGPQTPVGTDFNGFAFSHANVNGAGVSAILYDDDGDTILGEIGSGAGRMVVGGLTLPWFDDDIYWLPQPEVTNLHHNIIAYAASSPTLFADGFESGDTTAWDGSVGAP